jgi:hypothetical protein
MAGLLLVMSGCSGDGDLEKSERADSAASAADTSAQQVRAVGGDTAVFGERFEFEDGLAVMVGPPEEFTPSRKAIKGPEGDFVKFTVALDNGSAKKFNPANVTVTVTSGGGQAGDVIDKKQQMTLTPGEPVEPGGQISWVQGFGVLNPEDVAVVVQVGMNRVPVAFAN